MFWRVGLYRGVWRFASVPDLVNIASAAFIGLLLIVPVFMVLGMLPDDPAARAGAVSVLPDASAWACRAWLYRLWKDNSLALARKADATRVLILGAGRAGENAAARTAQRRTATTRSDCWTTRRVLKGAKIQGVQVLGTLDDLRRVARETARRPAGHHHALGQCRADAARGRAVRRDRPAVPQGAAPARTSSKASSAASSCAKSRSRTCSAASRSQFDWQLVREYFGGER